MRPRQWRRAEAIGGQLGGRLRGVVEHFSDTVINKLDSKGRVSVPARFRQVLMAQGTQSVFIIQSTRLPALEGYGPLLRADIDARLAPLDPFSEAYDALAQAFFGNSVELAWDNEGRIRLPDHFLAHAKINDQVAFVGMSRKFQIWEPAAYEAQKGNSNIMARESTSLLATPAEKRS